MRSAVDDGEPRRWRRRVLAALACVPGWAFAASPAASAGDDEAPAWAALRAGGIVLWRHAEAPGVGDPPQFRLGDCSTQRNLDERGRTQARRLGERLRERGVRVGAVWASPWCRTRETAELMALGLPVKDEPAFASLFGDRCAGEAAQTAQARALLEAWRGPGALVVVTHQVNISALVGRPTASGEGIVLTRREGRLVVAGHLRTP